MKKTGKTAALALTMSMAVTAMPFGVSAEETDKTVVRINMESEPDNLDPWLSAASDTEAVFHNVFEGLVLFDETGALIPGLAESWDISDDGLTYTFHLRDDVTFHNGKAFSAEDVVYTYESLSGLGGEEALSSKFKNLTSVEAVDDYTVTMTLAEADAAFLQYTRVAVLPKGYEDQSSAPVGTGPFVFEKYVPGQMVVLEKNEDYYDESRMPKIDEAQIYIMGDDSAVLQHVLQIHKVAVVHMLRVIVGVVEVDDALPVGLHDLLGQQDPLCNVPAHLAGHVVPLGGIHHRVLVGVLLLGLLVVALDEGEDLVVGGVGLAHQGPGIAIGDVVLGHLKGPVGHDVVLHHVLNLLHGGSAVHLLALQLHGLGDAPDLHRGHAVGLGHRVVGLGDGHLNFLDIEGDLSPVALDDLHVYRLSFLLIFSLSIAKAASMGSGQSAP